MMADAEFDYSTSGLTIRQAMVAHAERYPDQKGRPYTIIWEGRPIQTSDALRVPSDGNFRVEFLSSLSMVRQGVDIKLDGWIELAHAERIPLLRTWQDDRYDDVVEYPFFSRDGLLRVWNVYEMTYPNGEKVEEKWTENAGFWVEVVSESERIYHCSHGMAAVPDFESLVFRLLISRRSLNTAERAVSATDRAHWLPSNADGPKGGTDPGSPTPIR